MKHLKDIFYLELTGFWDDIKGEDENHMTIKGLYKNLFIVMGTIKWSFKNLFIKENTHANLQNKPWVLCEVKHNCDALHFLQDGRNIFINPEAQFEFKKSFFLQLKSLIPLFFELKGLNKLSYYSYIFYRVAYFEQCIAYLKKYTPEKIIFSADIKPKHRAFLFAAKGLGIKTYYFQHACVTENFPPLSFDVSFLDGQDTVEKYSKNKIVDGAIELVGLQRYGELKKQINIKRKVEIIGIAINPFDSLEKARIMCNNIISEFLNHKVIIRMHPLDDRNLLLKGKNLLYSNANETSVVDFLNEIDVLISGDSSIFLEASVMNITSVYYSMSRYNVFDYYGFVEKGLCYYASDLEILNQFIAEQMIERTFSTSILEYYDESQKRDINFDSILKKYDLI